MARIVFFCIPAHGHANPTLGVVRELIARGHQVWYYAYEPLRAKIEATGATFVGCDKYDCEQRLTPADGARIAKDLAFATQVLVDTTLALDEKLRGDMATIQPDCIVADSMAVWGKMAAIKYGIPFVSSTTTFAFNRYSAKIMKQSVRELLGMLFSMPRIQRQVNRLKNAGYPIRSVLDIIQNDDDTHTIVYTSPQFQPCAETFSAKYAFVGPSLRPAQSVVEKQAEKLAYISMGTVNNDLLPFYQQCIQALAGSGHQVILSVGDQVDVAALGALPQSISVHTTVDQMAVLEKADVFLTHCGMNSVSEALYHSVPLLMYPQTNEQKGVCERVRQLGAGLLLERPDENSIRASIEALLSEAAYRESAKRIADGFRACSGAKGAADKIESVCI